MISGVLLDISGVVSDGDQLLPNALESIQRLRDAQLPVRFLTNTTRSTRKAVLTRLKNLNLKLDDCELFTPAQAVRTWLTKNRRSPHLLVHPEYKCEFAGLKAEGRKAVIVGDAAQHFTYTALNNAFRELTHGADLVALAENRAFKDADGSLSIDAGAFVKALEFASNRKAVLMGKPAPQFFALALNQLSCPAQEVVIVGDDAESDVSGALNAGIGYAILVRTGKYRSGDEFQYSPPPSAVVDDIAAATFWILRKRSGGTT